MGGLRVWNYNKGLIDSVKGVKECEVLVNGKLIWSGHMKKGNGSETDDYSTKIPLIEKFQFPALEDENRVVPVQLIKHLNQNKEGGEGKVKDNKIRPTSVPWLDDPHRFGNRFSDFTISDKPRQVNMAK
jgi:protein JBTS26